MSIYDTLNPEQLKAVKHNRGPLLILAGAGSGKTRVLTHRIAYLIDELGVNPWNILAITFTNKAAKEMRERVDNIVGYGSENIWVSTFHSTCVRILRRYIDRIGYTTNFTIYDSDDQKTLMREVCKYLDIDTKIHKEKSLLAAISNAKDSLITPEEFEKNNRGDYGKKKISDVYKEYQARLKKNNALDFDDLICKTVELLRTNPDVLSYYQNRFRYIMVDEYQDTNTAQFQLIRTLASTVNEEGQTEHNLCVVGDDDQSIYKFRGANIYNILNFETEYPQTKVIKLEQNYRSTKNILTAANEVIHCNTERKQKSLWTDKEEGSPIFFTQFDNEHEEAEAIAADIENAVANEGKSYSQFALLYRTNAQSRVLEEKLVKHNIPYKLVGGVNFYQRKEIKDLLCYLKTIDNISDDLAVKRIINVPRRGIGLTSIDKINQYAIGHNISFYEALKQVDYIPGMNRGGSKISSFVSMMEILKSKLNSPDYSILDLYDEILEATGYVDELEEEGTIEAQTRIENIQEFRNKIVTYLDNCEEEPSLSSFLEEVSLVADIDSVAESTDVVILMTLHSAKGLEFPYVYLCGMEDGIFPSYMTIISDDPMEIEEERRLCYVGITRAMEKLSLSAARMRMQNGETKFNKPSRFVSEIPRYLIKQSSNSLQPRFPRTTTIRGAISNTKTTGQLFQNSPYIQKGMSLPKSESASSPDYTVGDTVKHIKFGNGTVTDLIPSGNDFQVTVAFDNGTVKKMMTSFAKLKKY
ncbi:DNA helicase PcrA [Anaeromicropila populeti]|uniref:ATP-dependent DNA helicase n=1 Tax=Anaeromicropila populeti TaxID=37658 RepID=A0A1I6KTC8_9FIRM|nr:DNA helicase PcrA [Anaeromicropila populeti]SFR94160.1 DNA helicase-2 / ATP-dependent DNA helicase PcrA [Anaeromicropila populeti]